MFFFFLFLIDEGKRITSEIFFTLDLNGTENWRFYKMLPS
jgi:hypothetical protein